jgi:hypothetical protein
VESIFALLQDMAGHHAEVTDGHGPGVQTQSLATTLAFKLSILFSQKIRRTTTGKEVDLVVEHGRKLLAVEIKLTTAPRYQDAENLHVFLEEYPETEAALLVHSGAEVKRLHEKVIAVPWVLLSGQSP